MVAMAYNSSQRFGKAAWLATAAGVSVIGAFIYPSAMRITPSVAVSSPWAQPARAQTVQERVTDFRNNGLPVASIAEMARVERKTVYSWFDGTATPRAEHEDRVAQLHELLQEAFDGNYRVLHRVWKARGSDGLALRDLLTSEAIDWDATRQKLAEMAGTISRYARIETSKVSSPKVSRDNPAISESMVVDLT